VASRKVGQWKAYAKENGTARLLLKVLRGARRRFRDHFLARRIGCSSLRLGRNPRVAGLRHLSIGRNFRAGDCFWLEAVTDYEGIMYHPHIEIGHGVCISDFVHIAATNKVVIGDGVLVGSRVLITDHNHGEYVGTAQTSPDEAPSSRRLSSGRSVTIGRNVWLGDGVAVLAGASIGEGSVIGANSVVTGPIPPNCIAAGMPARPLRRYDRTDKAWVKEK
jgi:lipopolysaccharide O-acetyltransferase